MTQTIDSQGGPRRGWADTFFGVIARPQTWRNVAYLLLAFPLGLAYFVLLTVGLSVGISLIIVVVGIPILLALILFWRVLGNLERAQARALLGLDLASSHLPWGGRSGLWAKIGALLTDRTTWLDLIFLVVKFPLGLASFVLAVTGFAASIGFMAAPVFQQFGWLTIGNQRVDSWPYALALAPVGFFALFASLHVLNGWAWMSARLAEALLAVPEPGEVPPAARANARGLPQPPAQGQWPAQPPAQGQWPVPPLAQGQWPVPPAQGPQQPPQGWPQQPPQGWPQQPPQVPVQQGQWPAQPPQWPQQPPQGWPQWPQQAPQWPQQPAQGSPQQPAQGPPQQPQQGQWPWQPSQGRPQPSQTPEQGQWSQSQPPQAQQGQWPAQPPQGWQQPTQPQGWPQAQEPEQGRPKAPDAPQPPEAPLPHEPRETAEPPDTAGDGDDKSHEHSE